MSFNINYFLTMVQRKKIITYQANILSLKCITFKLETSNSYSKAYRKQPFSQPFIPSQPNKTVVKSTIPGVMTGVFSFLIVW